MFGVLRRSPKLRACVIGLPIFQVSRSAHTAAGISFEDAFEAPSANLDMPNSDPFTKRLRGVMEGDEDTYHSVDEEESLTVGLIPNVAYVPGGHPKQQLDIYVPQQDAAATTGALPVVIHVHGGGCHLLNLSRYLC